MITKQCKDYNKLRQTCQGHKFSPQHSAQMSYKKTKPDASNPQN